MGKFVGKYKMPRKGASCKPSNLMAGSTGLEPAASAVTGQRSNQLNYDPASEISHIAESRVWSGVCRFRIQRTVCIPCPAPQLVPAERPIKRL